MVRGDDAGHAVSPERMLYRGDLFRIGIWRCPVEHPAFRREAQIRDSHLAVFPRTSVLIEQAGHRPVVADPNVTVLYNEGQVYSRRKLSPRGDQCDFFAFGDHTVADVLGPDDPVMQDGGRPFMHTHERVQPDTYLAQRRIVNHLQAYPEPDPLVVEEAALSVLGRVLGAGTRVAEPHGTGARQRQVNLVEAARARLSCHYARTLTLRQVTHGLGCSEYHLCRIFRLITGTTLVTYRNHLRLRASLERLLERHVDLTELALDLGYSSHSHFTASFRASFGLSPSRYRENGTLAQARAMSRNLIADTRTAFR